IEYVSPWARVVQAGAGETTGWQVMPEPTDEVLVAFANGQLDTPYVLGGLYSADRQPGSPWEEVIEGVPMQRLYTSRDGHQIIFDDSPENTSLTLNTTFGASCMIRMSPEEGITITTIEGQPVTINSDAEITINAEGSVIINSADVTINGEGAVTINAEGELSISAASLNFESEGEISMSAPVISLEGAEISLEGAEVNVAGALVTLGA
ncbi:MAG: phage baseplate assembly protein V, partial [Actinomycetes bacterium]